MKISQPTHLLSANLVEPALNPTTRADLEKKDATPTRTRWGAVLPGKS